MRVGIIISTITILFMATTCALAQGDDERLILTNRISERVLVVQTGERYEDKVVAIASERGLVVVDTGIAHKQTAKYRRQIERQFGRDDFIYAINTHWHYDHTCGNQVFADAEIIAHELTVDGIRRFAENLQANIESERSRIPGWREQLAAMEPGSEEAKRMSDTIYHWTNLCDSLEDGYEPTLPTITFNDRMTLDLGDLTLELFYWGPGVHTGDDIFIYVPEEALLITGDILWGGGFFAGTRPEMDVDRQLSVLNAVLDNPHGVRYAVTSHNGILTGSKLALERRYRIDLLEGINEAIENGLSYEQMLDSMSLENRFPYLLTLGLDVDLQRRMHRDGSLNNLWFKLKDLQPALSAIRQALTGQGLEAAVAEFERMRPEAQTRFFFDENEFNGFGYQLLQAGHTEAAIEIFKMNVQMFPRSANVYDSLGEAYMNAGRRELATENFRRSLELNPDNANAIRSLQELGDTSDNADQSDSSSPGSQTGLSGPYLGQEPPGPESRLFAPGLVSTPFHDDGVIVFTPDGKAIFFRMAGRVDGSPVDINLSMTFAGGRWSRPAEVPFFGGYSGAVTGVAADGGRLFVSSNHSLDGRGDPKDMDIWSVERTESGWSTLRNLGPPVNTELHETGGSVAADGTLYFDADYTRSSAPSGYGGRDIYCSRLVDGQYTQPQLVPAPVSSEHMESIPAVAPDHSYLVFASGGRADSLGERDLYVTFRLANGCWTAPVSLGPEVNSEYTEKFPSISPDGKYLFFVSYRPPAADLTIEDAEYELLLRRRLGEPREGSWGDIYWISTQVITSLRQ